MKAIYTILLGIVLPILGCDSSESSSDTLTQEEEGVVEYDTNLTEEEAEAKCMKLQVTGCIRGQIAHATTIRVNNESFFDVDELVEYFERALVIKDETGEPLPEDSYESKITDSVNNENFADRFNVAAAGPTRLGDSRGVGSTGDFLIARLPEGAYTVRVYKRMNARVTFADGESLPYCVTIYQDTTMDVQPATVASFIFDNFSLRFYQRTCSSVDESYIERASEGQTNHEDDSRFDQPDTEQSTPKLQLTIGQFEKINGLYDIESAVGIGDKIYVVSRSSGVTYFGTVEGHSYTQVPISSLSAGGITLSNYRYYNFASGIGAGNFAYMHEQTTHNLLKIDLTTLQSVDVTSFDCRDSWDSLLQPENIFFDSGKWQYIYDDHQETCSFNDGSLVAVKNIEDIPYGVIAKAGDYIFDFSYYSDKLTVFTPNLGEIGSFSTADFPFNDDMTVVSNGEAHWLMGCRSTGCYRSELVFSFE
ncbi:MAG: hypothetical protein AB7T49_14670 [Oligoflexales bacterium]